MFSGREQTLLLYETSMSKLNTTTGVEIPITVIDAQTSGGSTIAAGGVWHFVDLGKMFMATNGTTILFRDNSDFDYSDLSALATDVKVSNEIQFNTICEWRGRVFTGGFAPSSTWKAEWQTILEGYREDDRVPDILRNMPYLLDENFVLWSTVGTSDFSFRWLIFPDEALQGLMTTIDGVSYAGYTGDTNPLQDALLQAGLGMMRMPFKGQVLCIKPHAQGVIVYGSDGIALLKHETSPFSTFGLHVLSETGIPSRGAVGGDENSQCFVNTRGELCLLDGAAKIVSLDYREFFQPMLDETIVVTYHDDPLLPEFYICSETQGYVLTSSGLGQMGQLITSTGQYQGTQAVVSENLLEQSMMLETSEYDGGLTGGMKQLQTVRVASNASDDLFGSSKLAYKQDQTFIQTRQRLISPDGFLVLHDSAPTVRLCLSTPNPSGLLIQQVDMESDFIGRQFVRSAYGQEANQ